MQITQDWYWLRKTSNLWKSRLTRSPLNLSLTRLSISYFKNKILNRRYHQPRRENRDPLLLRDSARGVPPMFNKRKGLILQPSLRPMQILNQSRTRAGTSRRIIELVARTTTYNNNINNRIDLSFHWRIRMKKVPINFIPWPKMHNTSIYKGKISWLFLKK